eukprot:jgi/Orpsp1_1/1187156/evm.model.d7180000055804.1
MDENNDNDNIFKFIEDKNTKELRKFIKNNPIKNKEKRYSYCLKAIEHNNIEALKYISGNGTDIVLNLLNNECLTLNVLKFLINHSYKYITGPCIYEYTKENNEKALKIIFDTCIYNNSFIINLLLMNKNKKPVSNQDLKEMISNEHYKLKSAINYVSTKNDNNMPLLMACDNNNLNIVKLLVQYGAKIDVKNNVSREWELEEKEEDDDDDDNDNDDRYIVTKNDTPILMACLSENEEMVKYFVEQGVDINKPINQYTPLMLASKIKHFNIIKYLVEQGANVNAEDDEGNNSLVLSYDKDKNNERIMKYLIEHGANINAEGSKNNTYLCYACKNSDKDRIKYLLDHGADINRKRERDPKPLIIACSNQNIEVVKVLIEYGADINIKNYNRDTPLMIACKKENLELVKILIEHHADVNSRNLGNDTPYSLANSKNNKEILNYLLEHGAHAHVNIISDEKAKKEFLNKCGYGYFDDSILEIKKYMEEGVSVNVRDSSYYLGRTPLTFSSETNNMTMVKFLIENGAEIDLDNLEGNTPLHMACKRNQHNIINYLIDHGSNINIQNHDGDTPLMIACFEKNFETVQYLVEHGADVNIKNNEGNNALYKACCDLKIIKYLVEHEIDINNRNKDNETALLRGCEFSSDEEVKYLIEHGADITAENRQGNTALNILCRKGHKAMIEYLINHGANINEKNKFGETPLMKACSHSGINNNLFNTNENIDTVMYIVEHGGSINVKNNDGNTPLTLAFMNNNNLSVEYLIKKGADVNVKFYKCNHESDDIFRSTDLYWGNTPLTYSIIGYGKFDIIKLLIEHGADVNMRNSFDETPLMVACKEDTNEVNFNNKSYRIACKK